MPRSTDAALTFFVDRSLGAHDVPDALRAAGARVEVHDAHFAPDTPDTRWLIEVGARDWVVLTKDSRIRRHPLELQALLAANIAAFMVTATDLTGADMGRLLAAAIPKSPHGSGAAHVRSSQPSAGRGRSRSFEAASAAAGSGGRSGRPPRAAGHGLTVAARPVGPCGRAGGRCLTGLGTAGYPNLHA